MEAYWTEFLALYAINFVNLVSPGAGFALTVRHSISYSRKIGVLTGFGIVLSSLIHKSYTFLGFGLVISQNPLLFSIIKYSGAAFLLYMGLVTFKNIYMSRFKTSMALGINFESKENITSKKGFSLGFFTDLLNPQASLCFMTIVAATVSPSTPLAIQGIYGIALISTSLLWYTFLALFVTTPLLYEKFMKVEKIVDVMTGSLMIYLSYKMLFVTMQ